jgi:uncharacterized phosphatase
MTKFTVIRHGQTEWNLNLRIQGTTDIPLNETGREQAKEAAIRLQGGDWDRVVTSHLGRAFETGAIIAEHLRLPEPTTFVGLGERSYGEAEGMNGDELVATFGGMASVPSLERRSAVAERAVGVLAELARDSPEESVLVVAHGGVIGSLVRYVTERNWPLPQERIPNGSDHQFSVMNNEIRLDRFNGRVPTEPIRSVAPATLPLSVPN